MVDIFLYFPNFIYLYTWSRASRVACCPFCTTFIGTIAFFTLNSIGFMSVDTASISVFIESCFCATVIAVFRWITFSFPFILKKKVLPFRKWVNDMTEWLWSMCDFQSKNRLECELHRIDWWPYLNQASQSISLGYRYWHWVAFANKPWSKLAYINSIYIAVAKIHKWKFSTRNVKPIDCKISFQITKHGSWKMSHRFAVRFNSVNGLNWKGDLTV